MRLGIVAYDVAELALGALMPRRLADKAPLAVLAWLGLATTLSAALLRGVGGLG
jgi:hypothetical protein